MTSVLTVCAFVSGVVAVYAEVARRRRLLYVAKPLTMIFIIGLLVTAAPVAAAYQPAYRWLVGAALVCSLVGDVFLMLESDRFVAGVASFLVAHLCYIAAFVQGIRVAPELVGAVPVAAAALVVGAYAMVVMSRLWPRLGEMRVPVAVYVGVISTMLCAAAVAWLAGAGAFAPWALAGAVLFVASDTTLAFHRFAGLPQRAHVVILGAYFIAQYLLCQSAVVAAAR